MSNVNRMTSRDYWVAMMAGEIVVMVDTTNHKTTYARLRADGFAEFSANGKTDWRMSVFCFEIVPAAPATDEELAEFAKGVSFRFATSKTGSKWEHHTNEVVQACLTRKIPKCPL